MPPLPPPPSPDPPYRYQLYRPTRGRMVAGVCAGIARVTNTEPFLWRVLFPALTLLGGVGLLAYLLGWLLIPNEDDEVSPLASLFGRGRSRTSPWLAAILTAIAAFAVVGLLTGGPGPNGGALVVAAAAAAVVLTLADQSRRADGRTRGLIVSVTLLAVGGLALLDLAGLVAVPVSAYFALAVFVIGVGTMIAALFGRVRGPVVLGMLLSVGLLIAMAVDHPGRHINGKRVVYRPATVADLRDSYHADVADLTLDLRQLDFAGQDRHIDIDVNVGRVLVQLPPTVDAAITSTVDVGDARAFGARSSGINAGSLRVSDAGSDGPGGGTLAIDAWANIGGVEVTR